MAAPARSGGGGVAAEHAGRLDDEEGPQPLAAAERRVAHGGDEAGGRGRLGGETEKLLERRLDLARRRGEAGRELQAMRQL